MESVLSPLYYIHTQYDVIFHQRCDGKNNTLTIIKEDGFVFGGFTDIPWGKLLFSISWT